MGLRVGDLVEVLSAEEIHATLDERGELENLPFMPEMVAFCGKRLTVHKVAHKLCDTISGTGMRRMNNAVHLTGARCDGEAHGGCQTACSLYWKEAWLRKVGPAEQPSAARSDGQILLPLLEVNTRKPPSAEGEELFSCQATELLRAAPACLGIKDVRQYVEDVRTGNAGVPATIRGFLIQLFNKYQGFSQKKLPRRLWIKEGLRWGWVKGMLSGRTPTGALDLQPGELVRVKSKEFIMSTLNEQRLNRGLGFEEEMARYCGQTARVKARVDRCIDEPTGRMLKMKSPCIILEDNICAGFYNGNCPREFVPFWREIWLERVESV
ncbi:hypothetical protein [Lentzea terrae]|uniref:hypothetical protein n=1 Tax=Lentzea terrae TaxID=2200761 RepID=UPI000DD41A22|nr:hypothetical protein [Lentzea terrae]